MSYSSELVLSLTSLEGIIRLASRLKLNCRSANRKVEGKSLTVRDIERRVSH